MNAALRRLARPRFAAIGILASAAACGSNDPYYGFNERFEGGNPSATNGEDGGGNGGEDGGAPGTYASNSAEDAGGSSSGAPSASCGPANCGGCCDVTGNCNTNGLDTACGQGGGACVDCTQTGESCQAGACAGGSSGAASSSASSSSGSSGGPFGGSSSGGCLFGILCAPSTSSSGGRIRDAGLGSFDAGRRHYDGG